MGEISEVADLGRLGDVVFRVAGVNVHGYVVSAFCKSYEPHGLSSIGFARGEELPSGFRKMVCSHLHARITDVLKRSEVLAAVDPSQPGSVLGCIVYERSSKGPVIHYVYVDHPVRRFGLASAMLAALARSCPEGLGARYTHHTPAGAKLARRFNLTFSPEEA